MVSKNYYKLAYYNFVKQSKAKPLLYLLTNNLNFYISQFFKAFNFLSVFFDFAKNQFAILITRWLQPLVLTSITFDSLSRKIKIPCLVINKFIFLRRIFV